jgi:hypothetical protein
MAHMFSVRHINNFCGHAKLVLYGMACHRKVFLYWWRRLVWSQASDMTMAWERWWAICMWWRSCPLQWAPRGGQSPRSHPRGVQEAVAAACTTREVNRAHRPHPRETQVYFLRTLNSSSVLFAILCISFFSIETEEQDPDLLVKLISEVTRSMNEQLMKSLLAKDVKKTRWSNEWWLVSHSNCVNTQKRRTQNLLHNIDPSHCIMFYTM